MRKRWYDHPGRTRTLSIEPLEARRLLACGGLQVSECVDPRPAELSSMRGPTPAYQHNAPIAADGSSSAAPTAERRLPAARSVLRVAAWNTFNRPNNGEEESHFSTILAAIGNELVNDVAKRVDVLALAETDADSAEELVEILNGLYETSSYQLITSRPVGGERSGFVYDTSTLTLQSSKEATAGFTHPILSATFRPLDLSQDLVIYSIQLPSGDNEAGRAARDAQAALIRADADALGNNVNVLYLGSFNMLGSSEPAWSTMMSAGNGQALDLADAAGEWRGNSAFSSVHTHDAGGRMDDRFDLQFATGELLDEVGLDYVRNSYRVFGNNGTHGLNRSINTGTGASPNVLFALSRASDHLPVVADYAFFPEPRVTGHSINGEGNNNRSHVTRITLDFSRPVNVDSPASLRMFNHTTGLPLDISTGTLENNGTQRVSWNLSAVDLADGYYTAELRRSEAVSVAGENPLKATYALALHVLAGDSTGDRSVNFSDFAQLSANFGQNVGPHGAGDFNGDGAVNFADFAVLSAAFGAILAASPLDFGDAPPGKSYRTNLAEDGARHVVGTLFLGSGVDGEADGQAHASAVGDDSSGSSDEDGVTFTSLQLGNDAGITITASNAGTLNAWIDFNADGDWDDTDEQIFVDQPLNSGINQLSLSVPAHGTAGTTFARLRITGSPGYSYFGLAADGEVEDYGVSILAASSSSRLARLSILGHLSAAAMGERLGHNSRRQTMPLKLTKSLEPWYEPPSRRVLAPISLDTIQEAETQQTSQLPQFRLDATSVDQLLTADPLFAAVVVEMGWIETLHVARTTLPPADDATRPC